MLSIFILLFTLYLTDADLRIASTPKNNFIIENSENSIPYSLQSLAFYMEPSDFNYEKLKNEKKVDYDNFLRSNIDNEQDNRNFDTEPGRDMLPFRTFEADNIDEIPIRVNMNEEILIPLRWNNPHSSECEINVWTKSLDNRDVVIPIKKPSCCGEGYQDNIISFTIPSDFNDLNSKIPGFTGCNNVGDCTLQIYAHSVEPRIYAIGIPLIIKNFTNKNITSNISEILPPTVDPLLNLDLLQNEVCVSTSNNSTNILKSEPRYARLVSDQFNHAYQNSDFSPYSGQQHESISKNLQASTILKMTAANAGELGRSLLSNSDKTFIQNLITKVDNVIIKYETEANKIFNSIKTKYQNTGKIGDQQLENCFRCVDNGSVNKNRLEQNTYIPSFYIEDMDDVINIKNNLNQDLQNLINEKNKTVEIYVASLKELNDDLIEANNRGFLYQPAMVKNTSNTMEDITNFLKINQNGDNDEGVYASRFAVKTKMDNLNKIINTNTNTNRKRKRFLKIETNNSNKINQNIYLYLLILIFVSAIF
jgi:hypothetical protein